MKLKKFLALTCSTLLLSSLFLGCGPKKDEEATQDKNNNVLYVYNWGDYIDPELLTKFKEETGIDVKYDVYDTNEIMYQKLNSGNDYSNIPNYKYIGEQFKNLAYDPTNEYSVPYMWGTVGIIYNTKRVSDPVDSWNILWNPKYKDQVIMPDSVRDAMAVAEKKLGYSLNTENLDQIEAAKKELMTQKKDGLILAYMVDQVKDAMVGGEASLAVAWSGDAVTMIERNPDLAYAIPKEGSNKWFDAIAIPKNAKHKENAEKFINFLCDPENAKQNVEYIGYSTPNTAAYDLLPEDIRDDKVAYPDEESLKYYPQISS